VSIIGRTDAAVGLSKGRTVKNFAFSIGIPVLVIAVIWGIGLSQWIAWDLVVPWDSKNQFYAFFRFMAGALHSGSSPFWNPYHFAGHPSVADPQSLIFALPFIVWALFDASPSLYVFDGLVFAHLLAGGLALVAYGRMHLWPASASIMAAAVFMLGGAVSGRASHTGILIAFGLFPVALVLLEAGLKRQSLAMAAAFGVVAAQIALGRSQVSLLLCVVLVAVTVREVLAASPRIGLYLRSRGPFLATASLVALACLAAPMLLTLQFAQLSNRPEIGRDLALMSSYYPVNLATFIAPNVFGSIEPSSVGDWSPNPVTRPGLDFTDRAFNYLFLGSATALLILWHGLAAGRMFLPGRRLLTGVAVLALAYAFGRYTPLFPLLYDYAPAVKLFRRPVDATFLVGLALAFLTGHLLADYVRSGAPRARRAGLLAVGAGSVALLVWAVAFSFGQGKASPAASAVLAVAPIYVGLALTLLLARSPRARVAAAMAVALFTAGELIARNAASSMNAEPRSNYAMLEEPMGVAREIVEAIDDSVALTSSSRVRPRVEILGMGGPWQNAAMVFGYEATNGYNPLRIGAYDALVSPGESPYLVEHREFPVSFPNYDCVLSRLLGLEYLVFDRPIEKVPRRRGEIVAELVMAGPRAWIYKLRHPAPRVQLATRVRVADADAFAAQKRYMLDVSGGEVWVDDDDRLGATYAAAAVQQGRADIVSWHADKVEVAVESPTAAVLTLNAPWYPGWQVEVNGDRKPLLRANVLFRGVEVAAGRSLVTFTYRPFSLENLTDAALRTLGRK
jgi:hypothetical protein